MTVTRIDRRADYVPVNRSDALDRINEIQAAASEGRRDLERAYQAHWSNDWQGFLHLVGKIDTTLQGIRATGDDWAGTLTDAVPIPKEQLAVWFSQDVLPLDVAEAA